MYSKPLRIDGKVRCLHCLTDISANGKCGAPAVRCRPCKVTRSRAREIVKNTAHQDVAAAIRAGLLLPARMHRCIDCAGPAIEYDHRDYSRPLDVAPVCRSCNLRRGHGLGLPDLPHALVPEAA